MDMDKPPEFTMPADTWSIKEVEPTSLTIVGDKGMLVTISLKDGGLTFGESYTPTEAARVFWGSMSGEYRKYLAWKAAHPEVQ